MPRVTKSLPLPVLYRWSHPFEIRYKGIRDQGLLESAVAMPQASFSGEYLHTDLFHMAAAYAFHLAENQPFLDGNKRTALMTALVFLDLNGYVVLDPAEHLYEAMIAIANKQLDKEQFAELFRELSHSSEIT